jgi:signal transduction histidine kinase
MRRRLVVGTVLVIVAVLAALVPPVVVLLRRAAERELEVRLSSQASSISTEIADKLVVGDPITVEDIARFVPAGDRLVITDSDGNDRLRFGDSSGDSISGSVRGPGGTTITMSTGDAALNRRVHTPLVLLGGFAVAAIGLGAALAALLAARLGRPLEHLATAADRLGAGDFSTAVPPPSGIPEIDGIGAALGSSAQRLDQMLAAERSFTGDATHQLRTGLTGIGLQLELLVEHPDPEVRGEALRAQNQVERLTGNLADLLSLARGGAGGQRVEVDLAVLIGHHVDDWRARFHRAGRTVDLRRRTTVVRATPGFVGQIVDILLDNAVLHGRGVIEVDVGDRRVVVRDAGSMSQDRAADALTAEAPPTEPHGRGLALAQRLARADGGSLELREEPTTTFELRYPELTPVDGNPAGEPAS